MLVLGLIGGIGAGKTEVLRLLGELGAATVAADDLGREALAVGQPALQQVREAFGPAYFAPDGSLRRRALGELIFSDEAARQRLDRIVHPHMLALLQQRLAAWQSAGIAVAVVEAAVLEEMGALSLVDVVVRVEAPADIVLARLQQRDGVSAAEARCRLQAHQRLGLDQGPATHVLVNAGDLADLRRQVSELWSKVVSSGKYDNM